MATILVVVCSIFEAKSLSAHSEEETTRVNSFITRRSFHAATSGPKVPAEPCSPVSAANALCAIVPTLTRDLEYYCSELDSATQNLQLCLQIAQNLQQQQMTRQ